MNNASPQLNRVASLATWGQYVWRWLKRGALFSAAGVAIYLLCALIGLIPINNNFHETPGGVEICVFSGQVHSDLILPAKNQVVDWRKHFPPDDFAAATQQCSHIAIGWGDRGFYLDTPTWGDLKLSTAAKAILIPSRTVLHVQYQAAAMETTSQRKVSISTEQYQALAEYILSSVMRDPLQGASQIDFSYHHQDAFYDAKGAYHGFNTCNCWVGRALQAAGVRVPFFSPFPGTVLYYLPELSR